MWKVLVAGLLPSVLAATVSVNVGQDVAAAIAGAAPGDTVILASGEHAISGPLVVNKNLTIKGADANTIIKPPASVPHAFETGSPNVHLKLESLSFKHRTLGTLCTLATPYALQANFSLNIVNPNVRNNKVNLEADLGYWYETRYVTDIFFANCGYMNDGDYAGQTDPKLTGYTWLLYTDTCHGAVRFSVHFPKLANCGVAIDKTSDPAFVKYLADVEAHMKEHVDKVSNTKALRVPVDRDGNAVAKLRVQINREGTVAATITVNYPQADLQATITKLGVKAVDGYNTSTIVLTVNLPAPYTIANMATGNLTLTEMNIPSANATQWVAGEACANLQPSDLCNQTITFNITACDLTGQYVATKVPVVCQAGVNADSCAVGGGSLADITFFISTNNFCNVTEVNLSALFTLDVQLRTDNTYAANRPTSIFNLGELSYWSLRLWTNSSGVGLSNAIVTKVTRTANTDCSVYTDPYADITALSQTFRGLLTPPEIQMPMPVTAAFTCASAAASSSDVTITWTVLVDYLDETKRRRRRRDTTFVRRDSGELETSGGFGTKYSESDLKAATRPVGTEETSGNSTTIIVAVVVALCLCTCCCCCTVLFFMWRRRKHQNDKEQALIAQTHDVFASQPQFATSNMTLQSASVPGLTASNMNLRSPSQTGLAPMSLKSPSQTLRTPSQTGFATNAGLKIQSPSQTLQSPSNIALQSGSLASLRKV